MSGPPSGGRVRHPSPVRQAEPLLPVTAPDRGLPLGSGLPADAVSPEQLRGRRGRDGTAAASAASAVRRGRPCTAVGLLTVALVLSLG